MEKFVAGLTVERVVKENILLSPGPVVTCRAVKHGKRSSRSIDEAEYERATGSLEEDGLGRIAGCKTSCTNSQSDHQGFHKV